MLTAHDRINRLRAKKRCVAHTAGGIWQRRSLAVAAWQQCPTRTLGRSVRLCILTFRSEVNIPLDLPRDRSVSVPARDTVARTPSRPDLPGLRQYRGHHGSGP